MRKAAHEREQRADDAGAEMPKNKGALSERARRASRTRPFAQRLQNLRSRARCAAVFCAGARNLSPEDAFAAGKGGKNRSRAKSDRDGKRELHFKNEDEGQEYAQVLKMHGGPWLEAYCFDGVKRMCHICGKMGRKVRITVGDIVLISLRGFQVGAS